MKTPTPPKETVIAAWDPEIEDEGYDCVLFKITTKELISEVLAQLLRQRLFMGYTISFIVFSQRSAFSSTIAFNDLKDNILHVVHV